MILSNWKSYKITKLPLTVDAERIKSVLVSGGSIVNALKLEIIDSKIAVGTLPVLQAEIYEKTYIIIK